MRKLLAITTVLFGLFATIHVVRLFLGWPVLIAGLSIPLWMSGVAAFSLLLIAGTGAFFLWHEPKKPPAEATRTPVSAYDESRYFAALLARFQDHTETLRSITTIDLQVFGGYLTLQLGLGAWLAGHPIPSLSARIGVALLDATLALLAGKFLYNGHRRRDEVVASLHNTRSALFFDVENTYLQGHTLDSPTDYRPWWWWYIIGILVGASGIALLLFWPPMSGTDVAKASSCCLTSVCC